MAAVKANAYGHGAVAVARVLDAADAFAVATLGEGIELRRAGIVQPIAFLAGPVDSDELNAAVDNNLELVIHDPQQIALLEANACARATTAWVKLDSGMHRLGFALERTPDIRSRLSGVQGLRIAGWMTHLANADNLADGYTHTQIQRFNGALEGDSLPRSIANSAGIIGWSESQSDWVRPGIMLYGSSPFADRSAEAIGLKPVMTLTSRIMAVRELPAGEPIGYGGEWITPERMRIGIVAIGYGDGYPRHARSGTPVLLRQRLAPLVGRVSMDMIAIDLRGHDDAQVGDEVILWGEGLPADEIAAAADTIAYELFCGVNQRVQFDYIG